MMPKESGGQRSGAEPLALDPTVVDDSDFLDAMKKEKDLPDYVREGLPLLYS